MSRESLAYAISGVLFGLVIGWILGTQQTGTGTPAAAPAAVQTTNQAPAPVLDVQRASTLERQANAEPGNVSVRIDLGNLYFDAQRFDIAASWYEAALTLDPRNVNASTDLAVSYFSSDQIDRALAQFDHSLSIDPVHAKTLFNQGIVRAIGKRDIDGAISVWERLIAVAPDSPEAARAKSAIETVRTDHPGGPPAAGRGGGLED